MVWLILLVITMLAIVVAIAVKNGKGPRAGWTPGKFCIKCGARYPQDFGPLGPCPKCGGMHYEIRKGPL